MIRRLAVLATLLLVPALAACETHVTDDETGPTGVTLLTGPTGATAATGPAEEPADGDVYLGTVEVADYAAGFMTVLDSSVRVTLADAEAQVEISVTYEAVWVAGDANNPPCVSTDRVTLSGGGPAGQTLELDLPVEYTVLEISGCESSEDDDDLATFALEGEIDGETVTGSFFPGSEGDIFLVTATRQ